MVGVDCALPLRVPIRVEVHGVDKNLARRGTGITHVSPIGRPMRDRGAAHPIIVAALRRRSRSRRGKEGELPSAPPFSHATQDHRFHRWRDPYRRSANVHRLPKASSRARAKRLSRLVIRIYSPSSRGPFRHPRTSNRVRKPSAVNHASAERLCSHYCQQPPVHGLRFRKTPEHSPPQSPRVTPVLSIVLRRTSIELSSAKATHLRRENALSAPFIGR